MTKENNGLNPKEAQEALDSIKEMEHAGLKRLIPTPIWLGALMASLIGMQIALLGAGIRTYNTVLIVLICISVIAIVSQNRSAGVTERIRVSNKGAIIFFISIIPVYFLLIIAGQYLKGTFGYNWAPIVIGVLIAIVIFSVILSARSAYYSRYNREE